MAFTAVNINGKNTFLSQLTWNEDACYLSLLDYEGAKAWKAQIGEEENRKMASDLQLNMTDYKAEIIKALSSSNTSYHSIFSEDRFIIKKATSEGLSYRIAFFKTQEIPFQEALPGVFSQLINSLTQMSNALEMKDEELEQVKKERTMLKVRCEKYVKEVETLTPQLYAQFSVAFNSLKARVDTFAENKPTPTNNHIEVAENSARATKGPSAESDGSYDADTDIDTEDEVASSAKTRTRPSNE